LTLLESGQNPGDILRIAREKAGCSLSDISAQTKINEKQLSKEELLELRMQLRQKP
jgi:cytoskeleton protein RodZ